MDIKFTPIDTAKWKRGQIFYYYTQMAPTSYTVNVSLDVTHLRKVLKSKGIKFFPAYLWLVTREIKKQQELRIAVKDGVLGEYEVLTPSYPQFHEDDNTTSLLWSEYKDDFADFYNSYIADTGKHGESHGILSSKGIPPCNSYVISCIPWFTFDSFSLHNHGIKDYYLPSFEAGGFCERDGKTYMPLSVTVHHATTDGYHLKVLFEGLQNEFNNTESWLK